MYDKIKELLLNVEKDRNIDLLELHLEWQKQSVIYGLYADALSDLSIDRDIFKKDIDRLYAKLDVRFRKEKKEKKEKFLESEVKSFIELDPLYMKYWDKFFEISKIIGKLQSAVKSMDQKKRSLENEVFLYSTKYFSTPNEKKLSSKFKNEIIDKKQNNQRSLLNKNRLKKEIKW